MEVLACTTRKNKLVHASASRLGPEKLVLSWVRKILNSRMKMIKFCRSSQKQRKIFVSETWKQTNQQKSEKRNKEKWSFLMERLNRTLTRMEKIWEIQKGSTIFLHSFNINVTSLRTFSKIILTKILDVILYPQKVTCDSHPCKNNGTCTDEVHGYNCSCAPGFHGTQCEKIEGLSCSSGL